MQKAAQHDSIWQQPEALGRNRLPSRSPLFPYDDGQAAQGYNLDDSPWVRMLNGSWRFQLFGGPAEVPLKVLEAGFKDRSWSEIEVPTSWVLQGYGRPRYNGGRAPFEEQPPFTPDDNPTGVYRTSFKLPRDWRDRRVVLRLGAVESGFSLYVNGRNAGLGEDSRTATEIDITRFLSSGTNTLAIMVFSYCSGSYLETRDRWWLPGILRDVLLYSTDYVYIQDAFIRAVPRRSLVEAELECRVELGYSERPEAGYGVELELFDPHGRPVFDAPLSVRAEDGVHAPHSRGEHAGEIDAGAGSRSLRRVVLSGTVRDPKLWSSEHPQLYSAVLTVRDPGRRAMDVHALRFGMRRVEIENRQLLVNGRPIPIPGVNWAPHDDRTGHTLDEQRMLDDIKTLKRHNLNAVRICDGPADQRWYDLCDRHGIWVFDSVNIDAPAFTDELAEGSEWAHAFHDRGMRAVQANKNHPSVIVWSLGSGSGYGPNHDALAGWIRSYDPDRPLCYPGAHDDSTWSGGEFATDIVAPRYPEIGALERWATQSGDHRPLIMSEYSRAAGNSNGGLREYWETIERNHGLQGGFVWLWADRALRANPADSRSRWSYGGDFGDAPHAANGCISGLVWPDRVPHPALQELRQIGRPIAIEHRSKRDKTFKIHNKRSFTALDDLIFRWRVAIDGEVLQRGELEIGSIAPGDHEVVTVPYESVTLAPAQEAILTVTASERSGTGLLDAGTLVAWEQFELSGRKQARNTRRPTTTRLKLKQDDRRIWIFNDRLRVTFRKTLGVISSIFWDEHDIVKMGPQLNIWRAATDNDGQKLTTDGSDNVLRDWLRAGYHNLELAVQEISVEEDPDHGSVVVGIMHSAKDRGEDQAITFFHQYRIHPDGAIWIENTVTVGPGNPELPRLGVLVQFNSGFEKLQWFGRGPGENYPDRKYGSPIGHYESTVTEQFVPYIVPQENGAHSDVRWCALEKKGGAGLVLCAPEKLSFSALHCAPDSLFKATHTDEITFSDETFLALDHRIRGVGSGPRPHELLEQYRVHPGTYRFSYVMHPYQAGQVEPGELVLRNLNDHNND